MRLFLRFLRLLGLNQFYLFSGSDEEFAWRHKESYGICGALWKNCRLNQQFLNLGLIFGIDFWTWKVLRGNNWVYVQPRLEFHESANSGNAAKPEGSVEERGRDVMVRENRSENRGTNGGGGYNLGRWYGRSEVGSRGGRGSHRGSSRDGPRWGSVQSYRRKRGSSGFQGSSSGYGGVSDGGLPQAVTVSAMEAAPVGDSVPLPVPENDITEPDSTYGKTQSLLAEVYNDKEETVIGKEQMEDGELVGDDVLNDPSANPDDFDNLDGEFGFDMDDELGVDFGDDIMTYEEMAEDDLLDDVVISGHDATSGKNEIIMGTTEMTNLVENDEIVVPEGENATTEAAMNKDTFGAEENLFPEITEMENSNGEGDEVALVSEFSDNGAEIAPLNGDNHPNEVIFASKDKEIRESDSANDMIPDQDYPEIKNGKKKQMRGSGILVGANSKKWNVTILASPRRKPPSKPGVGVKDVGKDKVGKVALPKLPGSP